MSRREFWEDSILPDTGLGWPGKTREIDDGDVRPGRKAPLQSPDQMSCTSLCREPANSVTSLLLQVDFDGALFKSISKWFSPSLTS